MAKLYVKFNSAVMKEVILDKDSLSFGRKSDNDLVIDYPTISGHHGLIRKEDDHFIVEDLNSTNGTFINGRRVKSGSLKDRDQIGVAGHILDFYTDDSVSIPLTPPVENHSPDPQPKIPTTQEVKAEAPAKPVTPPRAEIIEEGGDVKSEKEPPAPAKIRIIAGVVDGQDEVMLLEPITYIGAKPPAKIRIKGFLAPDLAAAISIRNNQYFLKAIKPGYPKVNGVAVKEQVALENGAVIEMASSYMIFVKTD